MSLGKKKDSGLRVCFLIYVPPPHLNWKLVLIGSKSNKVKIPLVETVIFHDTCVLSVLVVETEKM